MVAKGRHFMSIRAAVRSSNLNPGLRINRHIKIKDNISYPYLELNAGDLSRAKTMRGTNFREEEQGKTPGWLMH